jgi:hypothetical protein
MSEPFVHPVDPNLPPLPLVDGCLFLDNTTMEYIITCARSAEYYALRKRRLAESRSALFFGGAIHSALEYRYKNAGVLPPNEIPKGQVELLTKLFEDAPTALDDFRTASLATSLIRHYNYRYSTEEFKIVQINDTPAVEQSFAVELCRLPVPTWIYPTGQIVVIYTGRIDLLVQWDGLFNVDHKTTSILGTGFFEEQNMSPQQIGYVWAVQKTLGVMPLGYVINAIRTRPPAKTRKEAEDDDFIRQKYYCDPQRVVEWERNIIALLEEFLWKYVRGYFPLEQKWCVAKYGRCQYYDVCELNQEHRMTMLMSGRYAPNTWSPLTQAQEKLQAVTLGVPETPPPSNGQTNQA